MAKVELKQPIVQEISEQIKDAQSVVVVDYRGLTVAEDTQLRKQLRDCLLYTSPSPRDRSLSRMPSSA